MAPCAMSSISVWRTSWSSYTRTQTSPPSVRRKAERPTAANTIHSRGWGRDSERRESVAEPMYGLHHVSAHGAKLLPNPADVAVDGAVADHGVLVDAAHQLVAGEGLLGR